MKKELKVKNDSIDVAGIKKDYKDAIMEYIWNGFAPWKYCVGFYGAFSN